MMFYWVHDLRLRWVLTEFRATNAEVKSRSCKFPRKKPLDSKRLALVSLQYIMTDVLTQVKENLLFYNLWTEVSEIHISNLSLLEGIPKEPLLNDETEEPSKREDNLYIDSSEDQVVRKSNKKEVVLPYRLDENLTPKQLKSIFDELEQVQGQRQRRIIIGIVNDDSTVVYYFIHDGVYKPKKN